MQIAGRTVKQGDTLYHTGIQSWVTVVGFDTSGAALARFSNGQSERTFLVTGGGFINGKRVLYWHEPLVLDLPTHNISKIQRLLNAIVAELGA